MSSRRSFLELKARMGALTEAEHAELERIKADRSYTYINNYGVLVSTVRDYTLEEWKAHREKVNAESQARNRQLIEEKDKSTGGDS
ncbi:MAG: hypothetical protein HRU70_12900 [Phycisphaeraceae bacterium]|nr:MAG: hypothetical protein HRU70_12900 [Phycisphaeraceae bacterium]